MPTKKTFRDGSYYRSVWMGKRTVKEGECAAIWNMSGERKKIEGPQRVRLWFSHVRFLDKHTADQSQYLVCQYRNGRREHMRGPISLFFDPCVHQLVECRDAYKLAANEALVVYNEKATAAAASPDAITLELSSNGEAPQKGLKVGDADLRQVSRRIVTGPAIFIPSSDEWVHEFSWHGSFPNGTGIDGTGSKTGYLGDTKRPHAVKFEKLRSMPDQMYYSVKDVRTKDDAQITVHLMLFYELASIEKMLDSTNDPIGDFINAASADVMTFGAAHTYESFLQETSTLSEIATFPILSQRMEQTGYKLMKVVYRGYTCAPQLQEMHNTSIAKRTKLRLDSDTAKEEQEKQAMELRCRQARSAQERELAEASARHKIELAGLEKEQARRDEDADHEQAMRHESARRDAELAHLNAKHEAEAKRHGALKGLGVDLTKYLVALAAAKPDQHLRIDSAAAPAVHVHP